MTLSKCNYPFAPLRIALLGPRYLKAISIMSRPPPSDVSSTLVQDMSRMMRNGGMGTPFPPTRLIDEEGMSAVSWPLTEASVDVGAELSLGDLDLETYAL